MLRFRDTVSRTQTSLRTLFGSRRWWLRLWLRVFVALGIVSHGWWTYRLVESAAKSALADELVALRDSITTSVNLWLEQQESFAAVLASQPHLLADVRELLALHEQGSSPEALLAAPAQARLRSYLEPTLVQRDYTRYRLVTPARVLLSCNPPHPLGRRMAVVPQEELIAKVQAGQTSVTRPFRDRIVEIDAEKGEQIRDEPAMIAMAPVRGADQAVVAILSFQMRPDEEFTRILNASRSARSLEAYAFDRQGLFLTSSRFDESLRQLGLIPPDGSSILTLHVRDPGANLLAGGRPTAGPYQQPFTAAVSAAMAGKPGVNVEGYSDYRGVPVVGAWTWLADLDMGLIIEVDTVEAFAPLQRLRFAFGTIFVLLVVAGIGVAVAALIIAAQQRKLWKAVRASKRLGHYTLDEKVGEGGMGEVYRGSHALLRRQVAIKLLKPELTSDRALARFEREVQLTSRLQHPNTIAVYDYGRTDEGVFYYVMEYLEGTTLEKLVREQGPQPAARVVHILLQACGSLEEAHRQELIHRDIKPANIVLCKRHGQCDVVKVLDFGLVKDIGGEGDAGTTLSDGITGTPLYLAPEAIQNPDAVGPGRDIYALGATGYWLLTGTTVFEGRNLLELCQKHVEAVPEPPSQRLGQPIEPELEAVLLKCLAKKPEDRYPSVQALAEALQQCPSAGRWGRADAEAAWERAGKGAASSGAPTPTTAKAPTLAATMDFTPDEG